MNVSIIIPSYNRKASTTKAVQSVFSQSYRPFEILVIDDCSRPEEVYVPEHGFEDRLRVIRHEVNVGVSAARNTGVNAARGPLIAFLDSDDVWLPEKLGRQVELLLRQKDINRTLVYGKYYTVNDRFEISTPRAAIRPREAISEYLFLNYGCMHVNTWMAPKTYFEQVPFDPGLKQSEDWDVLLRMEAMGGQFVFDPQPSALRHVDLRKDRLTTQTDVVCQKRFLQKNRHRLTPQACAVFESMTNEQEFPSAFIWSALRSKLSFLIHRRDLSAFERFALLYQFGASRLQNKIAVFKGRRSSRELRGGTTV